MGRNAKRKAHRKAWERITEESPKGTVIAFIAKDHYAEEWPNTSIRVHNGGIYPIDVQGTEIAILGHHFTIYSEKKEIEGIYGVRIFRDGEQGQKGVYANACGSTTAADLNAYIGLAQGLLADMQRNEVIPTWDDIAQGAIAEGLMEMEGSDA